MPQINRIRIINFSYNNNHRHIVDETFHFYQGKDALLSLKNGGGKSVFVQLLLQPILPKTKLMGRRIQDFFRGKKTPTYILIEWKLEDQGGYLLTGIGLANRESQVREQEDSNLKFFTFTFNYRTSNPFDIENIPLIKKQGERIYIEEYKDARKMMSSKGKDRNFRIHFFTDEEGLEYSKHLTSYNISQDEWRSIVLKINESEGGVIEIFEKCRTSQQLMNDWILKTVEKVVNREDKDQRKLEQMLENLVEEMIKNEQFIHDKEIYEQFLREIDSYLDDLNQLVVSLGEEEELEDRISKMYYYLQKEIHKMKKEIEKEDEKIQLSEKELDHIDLEERSKEYYDISEKVDHLTERYEDGSNKLSILRDTKKGVKKEILLQIAAREYRLVKLLRKKMAGIEEEINRIKNSNENHGRIRNLKYSLKVGYEKLLVEWKNKESKIHSREKEINDALYKCKARISEIDSQSSQLQQKIGEVESDIRKFEVDEVRMKEELNLTYCRNLLDEIEEGYKESYLELIDGKRMDLNGERESTDYKIVESKKRITSIHEEIEDLRTCNNQNIIRSTQLDEKIKDYYSLEKSMKSIFHRYDIDWNRRFNHDENRGYIENHISGLQRIERDLDLNVRAMVENITSLRNGTLHISNEFKDYLINKDIPFETGENYLRKQNDDIRGRLIEQNPILPFSFILYDEDVEKLKDTELDLNIYQIVPILSYRDIDQIYIVDGNLVKPLEQLHFMCLYDHRMIDSENLDLYLKELNSKLDSTKEQLDHYKREIGGSREDIQRLKQFTFEKNYIYGLEREKEKIDRHISKNREKIQELGGEEKDILEKIENYREKISALNDQIKKTNENKEKFNGFIIEDEKYLKNKQNLKFFSEKIRMMTREKEEADRVMDEMYESKDVVLKERIGIEGRVKDTEDGLQKYRDCQEGVLIDEGLDIMEERLDALKGEIRSNLKRLEEDYSIRNSEFKDRKALLDSYHLQESEYADIIYNPDKLRVLQDRIEKYEGEEEKEDKHCKDIEAELNVAKGELNSAEREVKKLADMPIDPSLIKLKFDRRRREEKEVISEAKSRKRELGEAVNKYQEIAHRIEGHIDISKHAVDTSYTMNSNPKADYKSLIKEFKGLRQKNKTNKENANNHYHRIRERYRSKNRHIENIFKGLDSLIDEDHNDKNKYYYLWERILNSNESLKKLVRICEQRLSNLQKNKNDMIRHSYLHGKQVYDEIQKIAENSSIKIEGKSRAIPMLKIDMMPMEDTEEENMMMMRDYVEDCINIIKEDMKAGKKKEDIRKKISKYVSTRELLNVLSDLGKMNIHAYKIDINVNNSAYKTWEQVMKENSGGERFVSFFAVLVALMSYTRTSSKFEDDYQRNKDTKVLIMDNPFGPISSEHLLKPLFEIANKYNTQLICLTDLKQNSIINCFDLIYMIKIRQNILGTNEYIQLEQQIKEEVVFQKDEMLEKASFKAEIIEQTSIL